MGKNNVEEWFERFGHSLGTAEPVFRYGRVKPVIVEKVNRARATRKDVLRCVNCGAQMRLVRRFEKLSASCARCGTSSQNND
jgi:predicted site-specific integrase-resolvase